MKIRKLKRRIKILYLGSFNKDVCNETSLWKIRDFVFNVKILTTENKPIIYVIKTNISVGTLQHRKT